MEISELIERLKAGTEANAHGENCLLIAEFFKLPEYEMYFGDLLKIHYAQRGLTYEQITERGQVLRRMIKALEIEASADVAAAVWNCL